MMSLSNLTISFIGSGVMAEAMINGLLHHHLVQPDCIIAADPHEARGRELVERYGLRFTTDNQEAAEAANLMVLSIKPQVFTQVAPSLRRHARNAEMILSILAGVRISTLASALANPNIVRAMPNTPAQIGEGITVWTATPEVPPAQREQAAALLGALGEALYMDDEKYLDMATALSGTGPAYVFMFMEALIDAGVHMGFSRRDAEKLVQHTLRGAVNYAMQSGKHPAELRNQVTSPGGTTAEALYHMEKGGLRTVLYDAVFAAYEKSVLLGNKGEKGAERGDSKP